MALRGGHRYDKMASLISRAGQIGTRQDFETYPNPKFKQNPINRPISAHVEEIHTA